MRGVFLLLISTSCFTQQIFKAGVTFSQTTQTPPYGAIHQRVTGFAAGVAFNRHWTNKLDIRPELLFIQKGDRLANSAEDLKVTVNYFEIPVMFILSLMNEQHIMMLSIEGGPSFGYGLGGKYKLTSPINPQEGGVIFGEPPNVPTQAIYLENPIDIGIQLGTALTIKQRLLIEIRYGIGLTSMDDPPNTLPAGTTASDFVMRNGVLQIWTGWIFGGRRNQLEVRSKT